MHKILRFSLHYPIAILLFTVLVASYGIYAFTKLPIDAVPDITNNQVQINPRSGAFSSPRSKSNHLYH